MRSEARRLWGTSVLLVLLAVMQGAPLAQQPPAVQQFPPGYIDPRPILDAARKAIGNDAQRLRYDFGNGVQRRRGSTERGCKKRRLAVHRLPRKLYADHELG
jgi:hypothetical protein